MLGTIARYAAASAVETRRFVGNRFRKGARYGLGFTLAVLGIGIAAWLFVEIAEGLTKRGIDHYLDVRIQQVAAQLVNPAITPWAILVTNIGGVIFTTAIICVLAAAFIRARAWWTLRRLLISTGLWWPLDELLKAVFHRARPIEQLVPVPGYAFPSGHAFMAVILYGFLIHWVWTFVRSLGKRIGVTVGCVAMILLIGASRVYLNVHWPSDVLGGYAIGLVCLLSVIAVIRVFEPRRGEVP